MVHHTLHSMHMTKHTFCSTARVSCIGLVMVGLQITIHTLTLIGAVMIFTSLTALAVQATLVYICAINENLACSFYYIKYSLIIVAYHSTFCVSRHNRLHIDTVVLQENSYICGNNHHCLWNKHLSINKTITMSPTIICVWYKRKLIHMINESINRMS